MDKGYDYNFVSDMVSEYICIICHLPMRKPVQTKCGHRFCRECLLEANKRKTVPECPIDRQPLNMKEEKLFEDKAVERFILSLVVTCANTGCNWQGELRNYEADHDPECDYKIIKCKDCDVEKPLYKMRVHYREECEWRDVSCPHCGKTIISKELEKHIDVCPEIQVECPNQCGQRIKRAMAVDHIDNHCPISVVSCSYCQLGCDFECPRKNIKNHLKADVKEHLSLVFKHTTQFQENVIKRIASVEQDSKAKFPDKNELRKTNQILETQERKYDLKYRTLTSRLEKYIPVVKDTEKQTQLLIENSIKIKSDVERERKHVWRFLVSLVIGMIAIVAFTSRQIAGTLTESTVLREELTLLRGKLERKVIWVVNEEKPFVRDFYSNRYGYKLRIVPLRRPTVRKHKEEHFFSFSVALLRGKYDAILTWPFSKIIKVTLLDQNENLKDRQNVEVVIDPKEYQTSKCLNRPADSLGMPFVIKKIILEEHFNATNYLFGGSFFLLIETENEV